MCGALLLLVPATGAFADLVERQRLIVCFAPVVTRNQGWLGDAVGHDSFNVLGLHHDMLPVMTGARRTR